MSLRILTDEEAERTAPLRKEMGDKMWKCRGANIVCGGSHIRTPEQYCGACTVCEMHTLIDDCLRENSTGQQHLF